LTSGPCVLNLPLLNVLIIPDKFKGTLSAGAAAKAIARGWRRARPKDKLKLLPMSDGGDGFGEVMGRLVGARARCAKTVNAAHRECPAQWWYEPARKTVLVDSSRAIGLAMLPPGRFHPFELDTFGLGLLLRAAAGHGADRCLVGIGGSATNDGGFGMARALGWTFADTAGRPIERWTDLKSSACVRPPMDRFLFKEITVAVDVDNPLLGPRGATRIYGPQKGLGPADFEQAEGCLQRLAQVVKRGLGHDFARMKGAGAAGGLGFGFMAFLGARLVPGFELFATHAGVEAHLRSADLVITGEGALDKSTLMGKGVGKVAKLCRQFGIPCVGLAGMVSDAVARTKAFTGTHALSDLTTIQKAKAKSAFWLERLAADAAQAAGARQPRD
jgi:glycerate kinase